MSAQKKLSPSEEEYLEALYTKQEEHKKTIATRDIAQCLGVKDASVTEMLKKLSEKGLVTYAPYRGAALTDAGFKIAARIKRKHRLLECFLVDICGIDGRESHEQACEIEHVISDKAIDSISAQLGHPNECPGGSTIPLAKRPKEEGSFKLSDASKGRYVVRLLSSKDSDTIHRLCSLGLIPGSEVNVRQHISHGPIVVEAKGTQIALGKEITDSIVVRPVREPAKSIKSRTKAARHRGSASD
ncbi:MAG: metal-dependent transcriptional regulator [Halobacteriota archaeon]